MLSLKRLAVLYHRVGIERHYPHAGLHQHVDADDRKDAAPSRRRTPFIHGLIMASLCLAVHLAATLAGRAEWKPEYASQPQDVRDWYKNAELTTAAQVRFPFKKCCDHADVVRTRFSVSRIDGHDEWSWLDGATWRRVPDDVIHWGVSAPGGQPTLFVYSGKETCFFPGESGN